MAQASASSSGTVAVFRLPCREIITAASHELAYLRDKVARHCFMSDVTLAYVPLNAVTFVSLLRCI